MLKKIFIYSIWFVGITSLFVLIILLNAKNSNIICNKVNINIEYQDESILIAEDDVINLIKSTQGNLVGQKISSINTFELENFLNKSPFILNANVFLTMNGSVYINVKQRKPIIKVINNKNESFYIDSKGKEILLNTKHPIRLMVANGYISDKFVNSAYLDTICDFKYDSILKTTILYKLFKLSEYIGNNEFLKALINQIYVNVDKEFELIPSVGNHVIIFGDIDEMKEKFEKLIIFYRKGLKIIGWNKYKTINLKFKNQVVCS